MVFQILLHHFIGYHTCTPCSISYRPKVSPPIPLPQLRKLLLQHSWTSPFHPLNQITHTYCWRILHVHMDMVFAHYSFQYVYILTIAHLHHYVPAPLLHIPCQHLIPVFRNPHYMTCQITNSMRTIPIIRHSANLHIFRNWKWPALKVQGFNPYLDNKATGKVCYVKMNLIYINFTTIMILIRINFE